MVLGMFFQLMCESEGHMAKRKEGGESGKERKSRQEKERGWGPQAL